MYVENEPHEMNHYEYAAYVRRLTKQRRQATAANLLDELDAAALRIEQLLMIVKDLHKIIKEDQHLIDQLRHG